MNTDAYYEIGSSHRVCEDYTLAGQYEDMAYAIVSDGCSSSKDSDIGARLLSKIAKGVLIYLKGRGLIGTPSFPEIFRELVVRKCLEVKQSLGLTVDVFDATLLVSTVYNNKATCLAWGDGYVIFVTGSNEIVAYEINYSSGAPYYLSYEMSPAKKKAYAQMYGTGSLTLNTYIIGSDGTLKNSSGSTSPVALGYSHSLLKEAHAPALKFVTLSSDGLGTYKDDPKWVTDDPAQKDHEVTDIISSVVGYKSLAGEFVIRRMQRMRSDMEKEHVVHLDDVSCATIAI
jgi:hypothetical protein